MALSHAVAAYGVGAGDSAGDGRASQLTLCLRRIFFLRPCAASRWRRVAWLLRGSVCSCSLLLARSDKRHGHNGADKTQ